MSIGVQCNTSGSPGRTIRDHKKIHIEYSSKLQYFNSLGPARKHIVEYRAMIGLLTEALANDVSQIRVYLDSELVVHQLNRFYTISNPLLLHAFRRVWILETSLNRFPTSIFRDT